MAESSGMRYLGSGLVIAVAAVACAIADYGSLAVGLAVIAAVLALLGVWAPQR